MDFMRPMRGAIGTSATWAAAFAVTGVVLILPLWAFGALPPFEPGAFLPFVINSAFRWALGGAGMGLAFSVALIFGGRKRTFSSLTPQSFATWGFVAGAIIPLGMAATYVLLGQSSSATNLRTGLIFGGICGIIGAALAVGTLGVARRAPLALEEPAFGLRDGHLTNAEAVEGFTESRSASPSALI